MEEERDKSEEQLGKGVREGAIRIVDLVRFPITSFFLPSSR